MRQPFHPASSTTALPVLTAPRNPSATHAGSECRVLPVPTMSRHVMSEIEHNDDTPAPSTQHNDSRRNFLRRSVSAAGALAATTIMPASIRKALAIPANYGSGTIEDIKHVVILMRRTAPSITTSARSRACAALAIASRSRYRTARRYGSRRRRRQAPAPPP